MAFTPCGSDIVSLCTSLGNVHHTVSVFCQDADVAAAAIILKTFNFVGNDEHFRAFERTFQSHYFSFRKYLYTIFRRFRISLWSVGLSIALFCYNGLWVYPLPDRLLTAHYRDVGRIYLGRAAVAAGALKTEMNTDL